MALRTVLARTLIGATNIRRSIAPQALERMKASILHHGLLQNLIGAPVAKGAQDFVIIAAFTRMQALQSLIEEGALPADYEVTVDVHEDIVAGDVESLAIALAENNIRTSLDFVDECAAFLMLAKGGKSEADIAAIFGYRPRTVRERLLIAQVDPQALDLVRAGVRSLDWARALTLADESFQARVVQDITASPDAWRTPEEIRAHLTRATIPVSHALFDPADYTSTLVSDFFEGDKFGDVQAFWALQNEAVDATVADLEGQGYTVSVLRNEPFQDWRYNDAPTGVQGEAVVEVMATGAVRVFTGKVAIAPQAQEATALLTVDIDPQDSGIAPWEVRPTGRVLDYASAQKSAILQARLAGDFEAAVRYATLALLGSHNTTIATQPFVFPGAQSARHGRAFDAVTQASADEAAVRDAGPDAVALVASMERPQLEQLFSTLIARRAGMRRTAPDAQAQSAANLLCAELDVRAFWSPTTAFFTLLPTDDLRRLSAHLVPGMDVAKAASQPRKSLIKGLESAFADAASGLLDAASSTRLNTWVPGILSFPATIATGAEDAQAAQDAESALFGAF